MYLLDTDVVSHLRRPERADPRVAAWADSTPAVLHFISSITLYELELGILRMERRDPVQGTVLRAWMDGQVLPRFAERILPIDTAIVQRCARLHVPDPRPERDAFIAATALVRGMTVVTHNVRDFEPTGVGILNPWEWEPGSVEPAPKRDRNVVAAIRALVREPRLYRASAWPVDDAGLASAGLYAWYVDRDGAVQLSKELGLKVEEGLLYMGQAGATLWPAGVRRRSTLRGRIGANHIHGRIGRSTFRLTLAAALRKVCSLERRGPNELTVESEERLSGWICRHLSFSIHPSEDRDGLLSLEQKVIAEADPPFNINGLPSTRLRERLSKLRDDLGG